MNHNIIPIGPAVRRKPEIKRQVIALPERRMNPLAVYKRNFVPEQDRLWIQVMKDLERKRRNA